MSSLVIGSSLSSAKPTRYISGERCVTSRNTAAKETNLAAPPRRQIIQLNWRDFISVFIAVCKTSSRLFFFLICRDAFIASFRFSTNEFGNHQKGRSNKCVTGTDCQQSQHGNATVNNNFFTLPGKRKSVTSFV